MSGLFDDEGKTPARGRKHKAAEVAVAELVKPAEYPIDAGAEMVADADEVFERFKTCEAELVARISETLAPLTSDEMAKAAREFDAGHPFEDSIKAAEAIAADEVYVPGLPGFQKIGPDGERELVNRFPISQERRAKLLNLVWERTRWRTGRVEWRDVRELLKDVIELL